VEEKGVRQAALLTIQVMEKMSQRAKDDSKRSLSLLLDLFVFVPSIMFLEFFYSTRLHFVGLTFSHFLSSFFCHIQHLSLSHTHQESCGRFSSS
jgi:hypothetical protein